MKRQSAKVQQLKGRIASLMNLVKLGIKKYVVQLLDLETQLAIALQSQLKKVVIMSPQEKFAQLKKEVLTRFNEAAWLHLKKWTSDHELNDDWYLSKIRPEGRAEFQAFYDRLWAIELEIAQQDEAQEKARLETYITPEQEEERKARAAMWLPC